MDLYKISQKIAWVRTVAIISLLAISGTLVLPAHSMLAVDNASESIHVQWPTQGRSDTLEHTFLAEVEDMNTDSYELYWSVDGGDRVAMSDRDGFEQTWINFSSWYWNEDGPYELRFIAVDDDGDEIARTGLSLYRVEVNGNKSNMVTDSEVSSTKREPIEVADSDEVVDREEEESVDDENKTEKRAESTDDEEVSEESELSENTDVNAGEDSGSESSDEESEELTSEEASANSEENNDEENESLSDLEEESNDNESSSDDSADKKSEELDEESENDSDISEWFTITGNVEDSGVGDTTEVSFTVVNTGGPAEDTIVDLEIFNEEGSQVYQDYKIDQSFENDQDRDYQFTWKPDTAGTYSASVGIFKPSWSSIYSWHDDIASFEIVDNGSSSSEENDDGSESVESNDSDPQDQDDLLNGDSSEISMSESDFYNEEGPADRQYDEWKDDRPEDAELIKKIVDQPIAKWFGGWNNDIKSDVDAYVSKAHKQGKTPVMVAYNIPDRDCGSHSAGGLSSLSEYEQWINDFADGIDGRDSIVILEPDAAALTNCLDDNEREARLIVLGEAAAVLRDHGAKAYIDASHANWLSANDMADRLKSAGIEKASGFALNTSNFVSTEKNLQYGRDISKQTNGAHFVIDTSRNGNGAASDNEWCNPEGRALGQKPTFVDNDPLLDAFIWTKVPGESDGKCNGGPAAGVWWPEYALGLAERADW